MFKTYTVIQNGGRSPHNGPLVVHKMDCTLEQRQKLGVKQDFTGCCPILGLFITFYLVRTMNTSFLKYHVDFGVRYWKNYRYLDGAASHQSFLKPCDCSLSPRISHCIPSLASNSKPTSYSRNVLPEDPFSG